MNQILRGTSGSLLLAVALCWPAAAQQPTVADPTKTEPEAVDILRKMGAYLRTLKTFQVRAEVTSEYVLTDGQKVQLAQNTNLLARAPDRLLAEVDGDEGAKSYLFDGKSFTLFQRDLAFYATVPAAGTLRQLVEALEKYDVDLPLVDLFLWGETSQPELISAIDIGPGQVKGISAEHYAFRQEGLDWQVWVQKGEYPLPLKLVLTTTTDEARPQHSSTLTWNLAPSFNDAAFQFEPPPGVHQIKFASNK